MRKNKLIAGVLSAAMVMCSLTLPENISIGGFDFGTLFTFADLDDTEYNAYLIFMTGDYSFRNAWDDSSYGLNSGYDYSVVHSWDGSKAGTFVDAVINGEGTYTVSICGLDLSTSYNTLGISTDIPCDSADITIDNVTIGGEEFDNPDVYIIEDSDYIWLLVINLFDDLEIGDYEATSSQDTSITFTVSKPTVAIVDSGTCGENLTWTLDSDGVLTISGTGEMYDYSYGNSPWHDYRNNITTIKIEDGVTSIGNYAFAYCHMITDVDISDSVTSVGEHAFCGCDRLTGIDIPDSVTFIGGYAFSHCDNLTEVNIPDGVTSIEGGTFYNCSSLASIDIPASVNSIDMAFEGCSSLAEINVNVDNDTYASVDGILYNKEMTTLIKCPSAKTGSVVIPDGVTDIEDYAFSGCSGFISIDIPDSLQSIGAYAFSGCSGLTEMELPESVESIGQRLFYECYGLADEDGFVIVNDVLYEYFGESMDVVVPDGVTLIDSWAFRSSDITSIEIPDSVSTIEGGTFYECGKLTTVVLPDSVTSIGGNAFTGCSSLTSIEIPSSVTSIGSLAFCTCTKLEEVKLNNGLESIGSFAFSGCFTLAEITIPASVTSIGKYAFGCYWYINSDGEYYGPYTLVTVYGYENTAAETYVEEYGVCENEESGELEEVATFVSLGTIVDNNLGDANGDDEINYLDAMAVLRYDAELVEMTTVQLAAADVNDDGSVNSLDAILILRYDAGLIASFAE